MSNLNKTYHKGKYRSGEWVKHLRPYLKRVGNKRWRKDGKDIELYDADEIKPLKKYSTKKHIKVKIKKKLYGDLYWTNISKYRSLRDAKNAMKQAGVIEAEILSK